MKGAEDFILTWEEQQLARERDSRARQELEDLAAVLKLPAGVRLLAAWLKRLGHGRRLGGSEAETALYNEGASLLEQIGKASPNALLRILGDIHGCNF